MPYKCLHELDRSCEVEIVFHESRCCTTLNAQQREELAHVSAELSSWPETMATVTGAGKVLRGTRGLPGGQFFYLQAGAGDARYGCP